MYISIWEEENERSGYYVKKEITFVSRYFVRRVISVDSGCRRAFLPASGSRGAAYSISGCLCRLL